MKNFKVVKNTKLLKLKNTKFVGVIKIANSQNCPRN